MKPKVAHKAKGPEPPVFPCQESIHVRSRYQYLPDKTQQSLLNQGTEQHTLTYYSSPSQTCSSVPPHICIVRGSQCPALPERWRRKAADSEICTNTQDSAPKLRRSTTFSRTVCESVVILIATPGKAKPINKHTNHKIQSSSSKTIDIGKIPKKMASKFKDRNILND